MREGGGGRGRRDGNEGGRRREEELQVQQDLVEHLTPNMQHQTTLIQWRKINETPAM